MGEQCEHGGATERNARGQCIECRNVRSRKYRAEHPERYKAYGAAYRRKHPECYRESMRKHFAANRERHKERTAEYRKDNAVKLMLRSAERRARYGGYACTITVADIVVPEFCPLLGIKLERCDGKQGSASPSLDKIKPELGYVPGNVWVVSHRANLLKNNATLSELRMLVSNLTTRMQTT